MDSYTKVILEGFDVIEDFSLCLRSGDGRRFRNRPDLHLIGAQPAPYTFFASRHRPSWN